MRGSIKPQQLPRLPWAIAEQEFLAGCNQCGKCIDVCESKIISRDKQGYPFVDFDHNECTFCMKCIDVCNEPLFQITNIDTAPQIKPWSGDFSINEKCLASNNIYCQSCRDVCDVNAITFQYKTSTIPEPILNINDCSQCGAFVTVCPQDAIAFHLKKDNTDNA